MFPRHFRALFREAPIASTTGLCRVSARPGMCERLATPSVLRYLRLLAGNWACRLSYSVPRNVDSKGKRGLELTPCKGECSRFQMWNWVSYVPRIFAWIMTTISTIYRKKQKKRTYMEYNSFFLPFHDRILKIYILIIHYNLFYQEWPYHRYNKIEIYRPQEPQDIHHARSPKQRIHKYRKLLRKTKVFLIKKIYVSNYGIVFRKFLWFISCPCQVWWIMHFHLYYFYF